MLFPVSRPFSSRIPFSPPLAAATTAGQVRGRVIGPDGKPLAGVTVVLVNDITGHRQEARTGADGTYLLYNVPPNPYHLTVEVQGFAPFHADVDVRGSAPVVKDVALASPVTATEAVHAEGEAVALETDTSMTHIDIDKSLIQQSPAAMPGRAFESIVTSTPGFSQDENGRYHFQGGHSQQLLVIDGQPIGDQIGITFSNSFDPGVAEGMEIITGGIPAEYGEKANGVINLTTRSGLGTGGVKGDVTLGGAEFKTALRLDRGRRRRQPVRVVRVRRRLALGPLPRPRLLRQLPQRREHGPRASCGSTRSRRTGRATGASRATSAARSATSRTCPRRRRPGRTRASSRTTGT